MFRAAKFLLVFGAVAFGFLVFEAIAVAIWHIWLSGHGLTSWLDETRVFPLIGESTPLDLAALALASAVGLVAGWLATRKVESN